MPLIKCLGVLRELQNSPNRESDDALILRAVLDQLEVVGVQTRLMTPEEFDGADLSQYDVVVPMCESYPRIKRLLKLESTERRVRFINPPTSILNCYRVNMVPMVTACAGVNFPVSEIRRVDAGAGAPPAFAAPEGWWLKRGDVHNTCDHDVVRVRTWTDAARILEDFSQREITHYVIQPHIEGDLIKFYGVGPGRWFTWFYHDATRARRHAFELDELASAAAAGAHALGLEIFGGDAIISEDGTITLLDLNSWPSFARVRAEAGVQIAWHAHSAGVRHIRTRAASAARVLEGQDAD